MSIEYCDVHGHYDTDYHVEGCPRCIENKELDRCKTEHDHE